MFPNVEALTIHSFNEIDNTPMVPDKFLHLKYLHVCFGSAFSPAYDYLSLVSFFDASPLLETFILSVSQRRMKHGSVFEGRFHPRRMPGYRHEKLKTVKISGFCSARSMIELTYHILENAPSLKRLTLDTTAGAARCYLGKSSKCTKMWTDIGEAHRALWAVRTYLMGKVLPAVELNVVEPCIQFHVAEYLIS
ncbi:hypothetical protein C2845_PM07G36820 [Panicum miliaceum]|uniref:At1g61320/AtMIF1 LRR domain-containing protein n=1 Tax=Panicum miliaceum TaxID=4540 RepID=A0A3L6SLI2_PANMI|nr:hypothetical protein C2845_PM07G36820 [Panicum miliaceum]